MLEREILNESEHPTKILRELGEGLILRRVEAADFSALVDFNARLHSDEGPEKPDERVGTWTRDLLENPPPNCRSDDFTVVENTKTREIVSSMNLISQTWTYAGIPFGVGRPELVGTLPEYRNRGLIRAQFEVIHQWSAKRGEKVQAITGIPHYYRQFGYEMCLDLGGGRIGYKPQVPQLREGEQEPYLIRPAVESDLGFIQQLYDQACQRYLVSCVRDEAVWRYELSGKGEKNVDRMVLRLIETQDGQRVGYLAHPIMTWGPTMVAVSFELVAGVSWGAVAPGVIRYLYATGEAYSSRDGKAEQFAAFGFWLGREHPVYATLHDGLPRVRKPYAWYLRLVDWVDFLRHIAPALEGRLANSPYAGHTGELKLTFYRNGLVLGFEAGRLVKVEPWNPAPQGHSGDAGFPGLTFQQVLFGYRSFEELSYAFADCWWNNDQAFGLVNALFPKQVTNLWPIA